MKSKFIICNSFSARKAQGCVYREGRVVREDDAAFFEYLYKRPSTPADVLTDCLRRVSVGGGEKDEALYCLSVQGMVDDSALVKMAGQSVQSGSGAGAYQRGVCKNRRYILE